MSFKVLEKAANILPPVYGSTAAVNCSNTVVVVDMTTLPLSKAMATYSGQDGNAMDKYVRITAEGGDVYFTTGSNFALLNAIPNTVLFSTVNATTGALTINNAELDYLPQGTWKDVRFYPANATPANGLHEAPGSGASYGKTSPVRYLALITASGNARARFHQSSD